VLPSLSQGWFVDVEMVFSSRSRRRQKSSIMLLIVIAESFFQINTVVTDSDTNDE